MEMIPYNQIGNNCSAPVEAQPMTDNPSMTGYNIKLWDTANSYASRQGGIFDGEYLWITNYVSGKPLTRVDVKSGEITEFPTTNGVNGNTGLNTHALRNQYGVFDGTNIWFLPYLDDTLIRLDPKTGTMTGYSTANGVNKNSNFPTTFGTITSEGVVFDGKTIWAITNGRKLIRLDTDTATKIG